MKMISHKIYSDLYWNKDLGWVDELSADRYSNKKAETLSLPPDGEWSPAFKNKDGTLTIYAFACGYLEEFDGQFQNVRLWADGCYHVRRAYVNESIHRGYIVESWETFDSLTEARKFYRKEIAEIKKQVSDPAREKEGM